MQKKDSRYRQNQGFIHKYTDTLYKLTVCKVLRVEKLTPEEIAKRKKGKNDKKLDTNIGRARSAVLELALCNPWDFFVTLTINKEKCGRYDLEAYRKRLTQFVRDYNKMHGTSIKYHLVPEKHVDGAWHLHGFIRGIPPDRLRLFTLQERLPKYILDKLLKGDDVFEWLDYRAKFGFCNFEPIRSQEKAARYVTKYITEELLRSVQEVGKHLYYCSHGLKRKQTYEIGSIRPASLLAPDYENDFASIKWLHGEDQLELVTLNLLLHSGKPNTTPIIEPSLTDHFVLAGKQAPKYSFSYQYSLPV